MEKQVRVYSTACSAAHGDANLHRESGCALTVCADAAAVLE